MGAWNGYNMRARDVEVGAVYETKVGGAVDGKPAGVTVLARVVERVPADQRSRNERFRMVDAYGAPLLKLKRAADLRRRKQNG